MKKMDGEKNRNEDNIYINIFSGCCIDVWRTEKIGAYKSKSQNRKC